MSCIYFYKPSTPFLLVGKNLTLIIIKNCRGFLILKDFVCIFVKKTTMTTITRTIKIEHEKFGVLLNETFMDGTQFKIFLKMVHGCIELKNDLSFFNGADFLVFIPTKILQECIVVTFSGTEYGLAEHMKSKIEALVTR